MTGMKTWGARVVLACGVVLGALQAGLLHSAASAEGGGRWLVLMLAAGGVYLVAVAAVRRADLRRRDAAVVLGIGLLLRLMAGLRPEGGQDVDVRRYVLDGGLVVAGLNPYRVSPAEVLAGRVLDVAAVSVMIPEAARPWAVSAVGGDRTTRHPPMALALFAVAHGLSPWSTAGWRLLLVLADISVVALLWSLLRRARLSPGLMLLYAWHPLLIHDVYGAGHLDGITTAVVMASLALLLNKRPLGAAAVLGLATGLQAWPLVLAPLWWRALPRGARRVAALLLLLGQAALWWSPLLRWGWGPSAGWFHSLSRWELNDGLFMLLLWAGDALFPAVGETGIWWGARLVAAVLLLGIAGWAARDPDASGWGTCHRAQWVVAAVFLLSPVPMPWHAVPLVALLVLAPRPSMLWLTTALPVFFGRGLLAARGEAYLYDYGVVWLPVIPTLLLLAWEARRWGWRVPATREAPAAPKRVAWESTRRPFWARHRR